MINAKEILQRHCFISEKLLKTIDRDTDTPRIHPTQKSVPLLERLIELFTDNGDVVIDPCAGSGTTLLAAAQCGRKAYGFEIKKNFYADANKIILSRMQPRMFV